MFTIYLAQLSEALTNSEPQPLRESMFQVVFNVHVVDFSRQIFCFLPLSPCTSSSSLYRIGVNCMLVSCKSVLILVYCKQKLL